MYWKLKATLLKNAWTRYGREKRLKVIILLTLAAFFGLGEYTFFFKIFIYLREEVEFLSKHLTVQLINIMNLTFLSMLFFSNLTNAIYYFFISDDLELLISFPVKTEKLVLYRYVENTFASSWMVVIAILPFYLALFHSFNLPWIFLFKSIAIYLPYFFMLSAMGCLVTFLIVNFFPAKRAYQILWSLSALFIATIFVVIRLIRPERLFRRTTEGEFMNFLKGLETPDYPYLPSTWITKGLSGMIFEKSADEYYYYFWVLVFTALLAFGVFYVIAGKIYPACFTRSRASFRKKGRKTAIINWIGGIFNFSPVMKNFFLKDFKEVTRDTGQWSQILLLLGLVFVYLFSIKSLPIEQVITMNLVAFLNTGILGFIMAALINRFVFPSFSVEGKVMWVIKCFPLSLKEVFLAKSFLFFVPLFLFGCLLSILSNYLLKVDAFIYLFTFLNLFTITGVLVVLGLSIGMMYPKFKYSNVTEVSFSYGGIVYMLTSMIYVGACLILQARPVYVYLRSKIFSQSVHYGSFFIVFSIFFISSAAFCYYCYRRGLRAWEGWE
jgi:ABC-2 type transport system permease protein